MAISKAQKEALVEQYIDWMDRSNAMILTEYIGLSMKEIDDLRQKAREAGGEFHVIKNTLGTLAFEKSNIPLPEGKLEGSTAIAFAFDDPASLAKSVSEFASGSDFLKIKGGFLETEPLDPQEIKNLADLPPMPVIQAQLLSTLLAPANKLARIINEPGRQLSAVLNAFAEKDSAPAEA